MIFVRLVRIVVLVVVVCAVLWLAGLLVFVDHIQSLDAATMDTNATTVDAIVVLTGGSERVHTGLELLKAGKGKKLFISGVHPGLGLESLLSNEAVSADLRTCCITLGHAADSTEGNAEETQNWLALENYHSLLLVSAIYHMPRSLLLFRRMMPEMAITPHPIAPESVKLDEWWRHAGTANLLAVEYDKYLWVRLMLKFGPP